MLNKSLKIITIALFVLFPIYSVSAVGFLDVVINEVAWMGSEVSYSDEWIELKNMTSQDIDLSGWVIENGSKKNGSLEIPEDGKHIIPSNDYYLISYYSMADNILEPKTIIDVITDWRVKNMGVISLANNYKDNGELKLRDNKGTLIDQTPSSDDGWPAGNNKTKQTMERTNSGDWQNSQDPNGTPRAKNSVYTVTEPPPSPPEEFTKPISQTELETPSEPKLPQRLNSESIVYPSGILINEVVPSPQGSDSENEYIELKNINNKEVDISNWKIQDIIGSTKTYIFPAETKIKANGYLVLMRPKSKITLNNDGDGLELRNPAEEIVDSVNFGKASLNQSYSRTKSDWAWSTTLTPEKVNIITTSTKSSPSKSTANLLRENKEANESSDNTQEAKLLKNKLASSLEEIPGISVFLIALAVALFCSIAFLIIKSNIRGFWY